MQRYGIILKAKRYITKKLFKNDFEKMLYGITNPQSKC